MAPELNTDPTNPWLGQPAMPEEEDQPLTLGQRIAAKAKPAPVVPAQPEPPPDVKPTFDPNLMPDGLLAGFTTPVPQPESAPDAHSVMRIDPSKCWIPFAAQYLARTFPCQRFDAALASGSA
jgi:hypothetical protein